MAAEDGPAIESQRATFSEAWKAASRGDRARFEQLAAGLNDYLLYPYLQYEAYRHDRRRVPTARMAEFLASHQGWAFTRGLETAWLRDLGKAGRSQAVFDYGADSSNTEVQCYWAEAAIKLGHTEGLLPKVQDLWAVGKSQPDACDPAFKWLQSNGGITEDLAWERIRLAMAAGQPRLSLYLARFLPSGDERYLDQWQEWRSSGYSGLDRARHWPDQPRQRMIVSESLKHLARRDADRAGRHLGQLKDHFRWDAEAFGAIAREVALWAAVNGSEDALAHMREVPPAARDDDLLAWWARVGIKSGDWQAVREAVAQMSDEERLSERWQYWDGRALAMQGDVEQADAVFDALSLKANFYGFLAADQLQRPYAICANPMQVDETVLAGVRESPQVRRALELREVGMDNWARSEWTMATAEMGAPELRAAAQVAHESGWIDRAIFALGNSGDLDWYEWRFPLDYQEPALRYAKAEGLDPAWVMGLMRSESAMIETVRSPVGALGLMQVMPATAQQIARRNGYAYSGTSQLLNAEDNIRFGTTYMREMGERFDANPALVSGAYNAGPGAVNRWLDDRGDLPMDAWVETIPYRETREYIPRVFAFSTIYAWRMEQPVVRVSQRLGLTDSGRIGDPSTPTPGYAEVVCKTPG